jgi:hypothetical protein
MGEASRRGTFEERKAKAIIKRKAMVNTTLKELETPDPELTAEEKSKQSHARIAMLSFMSMASRAGFSGKEVRRRVKRYNKKAIVVKGTSCGKTEII